MRLGAYGTTTTATFGTDVLCSRQHLSPMYLWV